MSRVPSPVLAALLLACVLGAARRAAADTPLPPPARHEASSPSGRVVAVADPVLGLTTVFRVGAEGARTKAWEMAGWYRALHVADDGEHLVLGFDGLNLLPRGATPALVVLRFVRRGEVTRAVTLGEVVPDATKLRPTASHLLWREAEGFAPDGHFLLVTVDGARHEFALDGRSLRAHDARPASDLDRLVAWMTGAFRTDAQHRADPDFFDITLRTARVWPARTDGAWLYVEQAMSEALDAPYRQRVYRVRALPEGWFESKVYELPDPKAAVGAWRTGTLPGVAGPEALVERPGCSVLLRATGPDAFAGGTAGAQCASSLRGASYATTEVTVTADGLVSWDRGYDAAGAQVWGSTKGGYRFVRTK